MNCCYNETFSWPFILDHSTFLLSTTAVSSYAHSYVIQKSHGNYGLKPRVSKYSWQIFKLILIIRLSERSYTAYSILFKSGAQVGQRRHQSRLSNCLIMAYLFSSTVRYLIFFPLRACGAFPFTDFSTAYELPLLSSSKVRTGTLAHRMLQWDNELGAGILLGAEIMAGHLQKQKQQQQHRHRHILYHRH